MKNALLAFELYRDMKAARKAVRKGWKAAENLACKATACVKKEPFKAIGFAFGVAFGFGTAAGWLMSRK
jgi:ElaB/YqjD/DUF883 family membrane-anchored ribosome-binding protein